MYGVSFEERRQSYKARIYYAGQERYIGRYKTWQQAALAYDQAARQINDEQQDDDESDSSSRKRARPLNFPEKDVTDAKVTRRLEAIFKAAAAGAAAKAEHQQEAAETLAAPTASHAADADADPAATAGAAAKAATSSVLAAAPEASAAVATGEPGAARTAAGPPNAAGEQGADAVAESTSAAASAPAAVVPLHAAAAASTATASAAAASAAAASAAAAVAASVAEGQLDGRSSSTGPPSTAPPPAAAAPDPAQGDAAAGSGPQAAAQDHTAQQQQVLSKHPPALELPTSAQAPSPDTSPASAATAGPALTPCPALAAAGGSPNPSSSSVVPPGWPMLVEPPDDPDWQHFLASVSSVDDIAGGGVSLAPSAATAAAPCNNMQGLNSSAADRVDAAGTAFAVQQGGTTAATLAAAGSFPAGNAEWGSALEAGMGLLSSVVYPHQVLGACTAALRCLGDLTMHLQQHQHMPHGCASPLPPMCDWLAAAWHVEVLSGLMAVLPATAPPALVAAAVSAAKAERADAAAPNRVALHLAGQVLLLCNNMQQLGGAAGACHAQCAGAGGLSYSFVLQVLWLLQQGMAALQRTAAAAPPGTFLSCRQLLRAYVVSMPPTGDAGDAMVASTVMDLTQYL